MINFIYLVDKVRYFGGMKYCCCGKSGILLLEVFLGFWYNFGDVDILVNSFWMVYFVFDKGIIYFDLVNNYGFFYGLVEEMFGFIMKKFFMFYWDELFIFIKVGYDMWEGFYGNWGF